MKLKLMETKALLLIFVLTGPLAAQNSKPQPSISEAEEVHAGEIFAMKYEQTRGIEPTPQTRRIDEHLQKVGDRVAINAQRHLRYRFHFDPDPNFKSAVALPGGQIFVGAGILAYMGTEDQLASVLGHEIEHAALDHCRDRLVEAMSEQHVSASDVNKIKVEVFFESYGHDKELAADREGVRLAMRAGYSKQAFIRLLQTFMLLGKQEPNGSIEARARLEERIAQIKSIPETKPVPAETPFALP
ncbi:MAG TPA: M48 family metallopeptidase [Candidatus Acidoferrales bacterium]|nr:M48 family metallopeptidase [Candidatus Acidoferrales bacterium]